MLLLAIFYTALVRVPAFFTYERCNAARVEVFAAPSHARKIGEIRWKETGLGCEVQLDGREVPLMGLGEESGFVAVGQSGDWARIRLGKGSGWIHLSQADEVIPYEALVMNNVTALTAAWDGRVYAKPGGHYRTLAREERQPVVVTDSRRVGGRLWFKVRVLEQSIVEVREPGVVAEGWIRAYSAGREPTVFYYPRGC
jgi:hypothetical protein